MKTRAFTLIELSIVLIVIGLIIGGVISSQSLIESASSRAVIRESNNYITLFRTFKIKYGFWPGDFPFATQVWGTGSNGNGNGFVENTESVYYVWPQHLRIANMLNIPLYYGGSEPASFVIGNNSVRTRIETRGDRIYSNLPSTRTSLGYLGSPGFISPTQAYYIDNKTDDGIPTSGKTVTVTNYTGTNQDCILGSNGLGLSSGSMQPGVYNTISSKQNCAYIFFYFDN